ncbi:hypothetical protein ABKN59_003883 [Abortiporus biennis]
MCSSTITDESTTANKSYRVLMLVPKHSLQSGPRDVLGVLSWLMIIVSSARFTPCSRAQSNFQVTRCCIRHA